MIYQNVVEGVFVDRPNRFIAHVMVDDVIETVHVKNTGRCSELLIPNCRVILQKSNNLNRKTKFDLISVYKENLGWVNIDSFAPNVVFKEYLTSGKFIKCDIIKPEYAYGKSRIDFYAESSGRKILIEIKGCTLEIDGKGYFPDAPTERGSKHVLELAASVKEGFEPYIGFVIAMNDIYSVQPNIKTDPEFAKNLSIAKKCGVKVVLFSCVVGSNEIFIKDWTFDNND